VNTSSPKAKPQRAFTAAIAHLAHSTPTEFLFSTTDFNSYVTVSTAGGAPQRVNGRMSASKSPGLGIQPGQSNHPDPDSDADVVVEQPEQPDRTDEAERDGQHHDHRLEPRLRVRVEQQENQRDGDRHDGHADRRRGHRRRRKRDRGDREPPVGGQRGDDLFQRLAGGKFQADAAVARQVAGGGEDEIPGAGEAHHGLGAAAERDAEAREFRQAARDQRRARVLPEAQPVGDADRDGHHVLHRTADLHTYQVAAVVHPQPTAVQCRRSRAREGGVT